MPLITNLSHLNLRTKCLYVQINPQGSHAEININMHVPSINTEGLKIIEIEDIHELVSSATTLSGLDVLDLMKSAKAGFGSFWGLYSDNYKPVYLLISE